MFFAVANETPTSHQRKSTFLQYLICESHTLILFRHFEYHIVCIHIYPSSYFILHDYPPTTLDSRMYCYCYFSQIKQNWSYEN